MAASGHPSDNLLNGLEPTTRLFRFLSTDRFKQLLTDGRLVLVRPSKWQDPFENFLSKTTFVQDGETIGFSLTDDFFGQCWTLREECDGLWRNFCGNALNAGVRIETTAEKLLQAIWDGHDTSASLRSFVGQVKYLDDDGLKATIQGCLEVGHWLTNPDGSGTAQVLLIKRAEFAYEHEVRALVSAPDQAGDLKTCPITPPEFIDSVLFAPKMDDVCRADLTSCLLGSGFNRSKIGRSTLYDPWQLVLSGSSPSSL